MALSGTVRHMAALDLMGMLPARSVGAIITDPPSSPLCGRVSDVETDADAMLRWVDPHLRAAARVIRYGGAFVVTGGPQALAAWDVAASRHQFSLMSDIAVLWDTGKPHNRNFGSYFSSVRWYTRRGARYTFNAQAPHRSVFSNVIICNKVPAEDRVHPSQKPVELTNFFVSLLTETDDVILDPFCGSGSTLISAVMCGRRWIGGDTDADAVRMATRRVAMSYLEEHELHPLRLWVNGRTYDIQG